MECKRISVSSKRQITIPKKFFEDLNIGSEVECHMTNNGIIITPVIEGQSSTFAEEILSDLIAQGLTGEELLKEFKGMNKKVRPAVLKMLQEAEKLAQGMSGSGDEQMDEIFGEEE